MKVTLTEPNWELVVAVAVKAAPNVLWTRALDYIAGPRKLKMEVTGEWVIGDDRCGPDGCAKLGTSSALLMNGPLAGCLIGKVGGSAGDAVLPAPSPTPAPCTPFVFTVGSFCAFDLPDWAKGALFLTMNDRVSEFAKHDGEVGVRIYQAWS